MRRVNTARSQEVARYRVRLPEHVANVVYFAAMANEVSVPEQITRMVEAMICDVSRAIAESKDDVVNAAFEIARRKAIALCGGGCDARGAEIDAGVANSYAPRAPCATPPAPQ